MIKFRCENCDKKIGVPEKYAGKLVKCPQCAEPARVPQPEPEPGPELEPVPAADNIWSDELMPPVPTDSPPSANYLEDVPVPPPPMEASPTASGKTKLIKSVETGISFGKDLLSLMSPIKNGGDAIVFIIFLIIFALANVNLPFSIPLMGWAQLLLKGILFTFLFNVLLETANGNNHLPEFEMPESYGDLIRPYLQVVVSGLFAFLPLIISIIFAVVLLDSSVLDGYISADSTSEDSYLAQNDSFFDSFPEVAEQGNLDSEPNAIPIEEGFPGGAEDIYTDTYNEADTSSQDLLMTVIFVVLFFLGLFFGPMIVLNIVLGDTYLVNPIKVIMNIIRTFKAYFVCCIALFAAAGLTYLSIFTITLDSMMENNSYYLIFALIATVIGGFSVQIYAMRVLGLLYRYHEEGLDW